MIGTMAGNGDAYSAFRYGVSAMSSEPEPRDRQAEEDARSRQRS